MAPPSTWKAALLFVATLAVATHARQLRSEAPSTLEAPCSTGWRATLKQTLANTLTSSQQGRGEATISLLDEDTLYFAARVPAEMEVKGLEIQISQQAEPLSMLELPLTTQMSNEVEGFVHRNSTDTFDLLVEVLQNGKARIYAQVAAPSHQSLIGLLESDCDSEQLTEIVVEWAEWLAPEDSIPTCDDPAFPDLYEIPEKCAGFADRVQQFCGIDSEAVMVASSHNQNGTFIGYGIAGAACLPKGCDPCAAPVGSRIPEPSFVVKGQPGCQEQGFLARYEVPETCNNFAQRLHDFCGLSLPQVMQASSHDAYGQMLGLELQSTVCLPEDCDPCALYPTEKSPALSAEPDCENTYFFTKAYSIPAGCGYVPQALEAVCGVNVQAVAEASGHSRFPEYAGFGEGRTICVPETCDPCRGEGDVTVMLDAFDGEDNLAALNAEYDLAAFDGEDDVAVPLEPLEASQRVSIHISMQ